LNQSSGDSFGDWLELERGSQFSRFIKRRIIAAEIAGNNNAARIAMIAMTTSSSINVKARFWLTPNQTVMATQ